MDLSPEQLEIVNADLVPMCVTACAGSGKTKTAVHRVRNIASQLSDQGEKVALLSFSNVAIQTFRQALQELDTASKHSYSNRIYIDTFDGFLSSHIVRPHGNRFMNCKEGVTPYLVTNENPFLKNKKFCFHQKKTNGNGSFPIAPTRIRIRHEENELIFEYQDDIGNIHSIPKENGKAITFSLGKSGFFTYSGANLWANIILSKEPYLSKIITRKYPHIIVDEAQDVGSLHERLLNRLIDSGSVISIFGDSDQSIYEFIGAKGDFINTYNSRVNVLSMKLTKNYRSVKEIVDVSMKVSGKSLLHNIEKKNDLQGAFVYWYSDTNQAISSFLRRIESAELDFNDSAILSRSNSNVEKANGHTLPFPNKKKPLSNVTLFLKASIQRDININLAESFRNCSLGILGLMNTGYNSWEKILEGYDDTYWIQLRQTIWEFVRDKENGLPSSELNMKEEWQPLLIKNLDLLLERVKNNFEITADKNPSQSLKKTNLLDIPLKQFVNSSPKAGIRVCTVHKAKGESIGSVLYLTSEKAHFEGFTLGTTNEVGRIAYVALTRAKHLFVLAVPKKYKDDYQNAFNSCGLVDIT